MQDKGVVIQAVKDNFYVLINNQTHICQASQKIKLTSKIVCGDNVAVDVANNYIIEVLQRKNLIKRPKVANIDKVFIIGSFKEPDLTTLLIDKMILFYSFYGIKPLLVFHKKDLVKNSKYNIIINDYKKAGYQVLVSSLQNLDFTFFAKEIKNCISMFVGQSGVGKTSILNQLAPHLRLKTQKISKSLNRGVHTTTKATLYKLFNGLVCDTPGFSTIEQIAFKPIELSNQFLDFKKYMSKCQFNNCIHLNEINCKIKDEVGKSILKERYDNYTHIIKNLKGVQ